MSNEVQQQYDDEIDLVELISNLWKEKLIILVCTGIAIALCLIYLLITPPTYEAKVQLKMPTVADLAPLNNTQLFSLLTADSVQATEGGFTDVSPGDAFNDLLIILESDSLINKVIDSHQILIAKVLDRNQENITSDNIGAQDLFSINYPNTKNSEPSLQPSIVEVKLETKDRQAGIGLLNTLVNSAEQAYTNNWNTKFRQLKGSTLDQLQTEYSLLDASLNERKRNRITELKEEQALAIKLTEDELTARKSYILSTRKDRIIQLEEAIKIAEALDLQKPSTLSQLGQTNRPSNGQVEVNTEIRNDGEPLYLRGVNLLSAELSGLQNLSNETFLDSKVRELETKLMGLTNNREIEILEKRESNLAFSAELQTITEQINKLESSQFPTELNINITDSDANSPSSPIKPKKALVLIISILLGGMIGLFIAIGRIVYKNRQA